MLKWWRNQIPTEMQALIFRSKYQLNGIEQRFEPHRGARDFLIRPDRPWGPPSLLSNWYRISFLGEKAAGALR